MTLYINNTHHLPPELAVYWHKAQRGMKIGLIYYLKCMYYCNDWQKLGNLEKVTLSMITSKQISPSFRR